MRITNFDNTGLDRVEQWIEKNRHLNLDDNVLSEVLKTVNISFVAEKVNRMQSMLLCELKDSYVQQSQRYVTMGENAYDLPELEEEDTNKAKELVDKLFRLYSDMSQLKDGDFKGRPKNENYKYGIPIEDARYILPISTKTNLFCAMTGDKLIDLYSLIQDEAYSSIFYDFSKELEKYIPSNILSVLHNQKNTNSEIINISESFYIDDFNKIDEDNNMILVDSFEDLDLKVGLGALTSTQKRTPSETIEIWKDEAKTKAKNVAKRVLGYGHDSIAEQARTTFGMMCSLVTYHQQVRHRLTNNHREPLVNLIKDKERLAVSPPTIRESKFNNEYLNLIDKIKDFRIYIYEKYGFDKALYFLLNADQIKIIISSNARMDINMLSERICLNAQWEIRDLSTKKLMILRTLSDTLYEKALPSCVNGKCKEGRLSCGKVLEVKRKFSQSKAKN
ncbi:MAG: thymidylate synthase thyx [Firmicutes bacterium]|nr:thymidylate synthase thyx [Bacillota bacterium]